MSFGERWWAGRGGAPAGVHELPANGVLQLPGGRGTSVRVVHGQVVVTRAGDPEDHVLQPGDELALAGSVRVLAWALEASRLEVRRESARSALPAAPLLAR